MHERKRPTTSLRAVTAAEGLNREQRKEVIATSQVKRGTHVRLGIDVICLTERARSREAVPYATSTDGLCCAWLYARHRR